MIKKRDICFHLWSLRRRQWRRRPRLSPSWRSKPSRGGLWRSRCPQCPPCRCCHCHPQKSAPARYCLLSQEWWENGWLLYVIKRGTICVMPPLLHIMVDGVSVQKKDSSCDIPWIIIIAPLQSVHYLNDGQIRYASKVWDMPLRFELMLVKFEQMLVKCQINTKWL